MFKELMRKYNVFHLHKEYHDPKTNMKMLASWERSLGPERILRFKTPKACIDVLLGAVALTSGSRDLKGYL